VANFRLISAQLFDKTMDFGQLPRNYCFGK